MQQNDKKLLLLYYLSQNQRLPEAATIRVL